jgi:hypothetical protein
VGAAGLTGLWADGGRIWRKFVNIRRRARYKNVTTSTRREMRGAVAAGGGAYFRKTPTIAILHTRQTTSRIT